MRLIALIICFAVGLAASSFASTTGKYHSLPAAKIVNTGKILRGSKAMRIGCRTFLVSSTRDAYARAMIAKYCRGMKKKTFLAKK